jgi:GNAT superfamily N-acetyltransferase
MPGSLDPLGGATRVWSKPPYLVTTDPEAVDLDVVHHFLTRSYWAEGIPRATVQRSITASVNFSLIHDTEGQVGFARVVTDCATFAYLCDVFVLESHRGRGLGEWMCSRPLDHPALQGLRRWLLATRDAHSLYTRLGFERPLNPTSLMERFDPDIYRATGRES